MAFDSSYASSTYAKRDNVPNETSSILPFFGFKHKITSDSHQVSYGGGVTINYKGGGTYEAKQNPTYHTYESTYRAIFYRATPPIGELRQLENRFIDALESNKRFEKKYTLGTYQTDVFSLPYIPLSVQEYYKDPEEIGGTIGCLFGFLSLLPLMMFFAGGIQDGLPAAIFGLSLIVIPLIAFGLVRFIINLLIKPYVQLSQDKRKVIREKYLKNMEKKYGKEAGAILQEYAILKGYDRI